MAAALTPLPYPSKLASSRILVIGGTSGIGFAIAALALAEGAMVHISSSTTRKLEQAISRLRAGYPSAAANISGSNADLAEEENLEQNLKALFDEAAASGPLDHIAFTAGDSLPGLPLAEFEPAKIRKAGTVRFVAPMMMAKVVAASPSYLRKSLRSSITLTSGSNGAKPVPNWAVIAAYVAGVEGLIRGLNIDLKPVRVNAVSPGAVLTELFIDAFSEGSLDAFRQQTTTGQLGRPEDIAESYLAVMRDPGLAGKVIDSDSGRLLA